MDFVWNRELFKKDSDEIKVYDDLVDFQPLKLLKALEDAFDGEMIKDRTKYEAIIAKFADDLHLMTREVFSVVFGTELANLLKRLDELEEIVKKHRHKTFAGLYTEKPAW